MKHPLTTISLVALGLAFAWMHASGQEMETRQSWREIDRTAVFEPFGAWQRTQFVATSMVNPKTAENARVLYAYSAQNLVGKNVKLDSAAIAKVEPGSSSLRLVSEEEGSKIVSAISGGGQVPADYKVLAIDKLTEAKPQEVIAWPDQKME